MRDQVARDQAVIDLVAVMASVYSFVDAIVAVPEKAQILENTIKSFSIQTAECTMFIREYTGKGFGGM